MILPRPQSPFKKLRVYGESITLDTSGKVLVLPSGNPYILPSHNEYTLNPNRLSIAESPFGGLKGFGSPDYAPGTVFCQTDGVYLTDTSGTNSTKTLSAGKLKELNLLTVDAAAHTITEEFIVSNNSVNNTPTTICDGSATSGWALGSGTQTSFTSENGRLKLIGRGTTSSGLKIKGTSISLATNQFLTFKIECNSIKNLYCTIIQGANSITWRGTRFPLSQNNEIVFVLPLTNTAGTSGILPSDVVGTVIFSNPVDIWIGTDQIDASDITIYLDDIKADVAKTVFIELQTQDFLADSSLQIQAHNGTSYQTTGTYKLDSTYSAVGTPTSANWTLNDGTKLDDVYGTGLGRALFPKNVSGEKSTGSTGTMVYSANAGTKNRIGLMVSLPPSDGGRTNFNKIRLKTVLSYAPDSQGNYSASYGFVDSTNASYGLQNLTKPWIALYDPSKSEIDFFLFTHRPKNLEFKRDETGTIHEITLYPGNGQVYHGRVTHCNPSLDSDSNFIPNCIKNDSGHFITQDGQLFTTADNTYFDISVTDHESLYNFLKSYGMVIS